MLCKLQPPRIKRHLGYHISTSISVSANVTINRSDSAFVALVPVTTMPRPTERAEVLARLRKTIASGKAILGAGAGKYFEIEKTCMVPKLL